MSRSLSWGQSLILGIFVLIIVSLGTLELIRIGNKQGAFPNSFELAVLVADAVDVEKGTVVKIRGVEAGQVIAVEYLDEDEMKENSSNKRDSFGVRLRLNLGEKFRNRLYKDCTAQIVARGLLGTNIVNIYPGHAEQGLLTSYEIRAKSGADLNDVSDKLYQVAEQTQGLLKDIQSSTGTIARLVKEDDLYQDLRQITSNTKTLLQQVNTSVGSVQKELEGVRDFVRQGIDATGAIKQNAEAIKGMPLIRNYVEDAPTLLVRPDFNQEKRSFVDADLFEPNRAVLTSTAKESLTLVAQWLNQQKVYNSEIVVVSFLDPKNPDFTYAGAKKLTEKRSEVIVEFLREQGVHKISFWTRRKVTPLGMGKDLSPVVDKSPLPPSRCEIILFTPA